MDFDHVRTIVNNFMHDLDRGEIGSFQPDKYKFLTYAIKIPLVGLWGIYTLKERKEELI